MSLAIKKVWYGLLFLMPYLAAEESPQVVYITEQEHLALFLQSIETTDKLFFGSNSALLSEPFSFVDQSGQAHALEEGASVQALLQASLLENILVSQSRVMAALGLQRERLLYKIADTFYTQYDFLVACGKKYPRRFIALGSSFISLICFGMWCKVYNKLPYLVWLTSYLNKIGYLCIRAYSLLNPL